MSDDQREGSLLDVNSLERIVPDELDTSGATGQATLQLHLERYAFASRHLRAGTVLDIACGVGYGTRLLVENPVVSQIHGVDVSTGAIAYASTHYGHHRIDYYCQDATTFRGLGAYDNVISLETIEHVPDAASLFRHLAGLVRPGGILVASVPTTPSMDGNPNHLTDFTERSFRKLGSVAALEENACLPQVQQFDPAAVALGQEKRLQRTRYQLLRFYLHYPPKLVARIATTLRCGFENRYLTIVWERPPHQ